MEKTEQEKIKIALKLASGLDQKLIGLRAYSLHPDDHYLGVAVTAEKVGPNENHPYVTYLVNFDQPSFSSGSYRLDLNSAMGVFLKAEKYKNGPKRGKVYFINMGGEK